MQAMPATPVNLMTGTRPMQFSTCDLCDKYPDRVRVLELALRDFGARARFAGRIVTIKCHEDNSLVRELVAQPGAGAVLVIDGGGSLRRALLGDMLAGKAVANGWEGVVVHGAVRDVEVIKGLDIGVRALGSTPLKTDKKGIGERDVAVRFGGVDFTPGEYLYADENGIITSATALIEA
jgi:regulator of ribonuclease activity A